MLSRRRAIAEVLEDRRVLAGLVNIDTATTPGSMTITGDVSSNDIQIVGTANPGQFVVTGNSTLLRLDGGLQTFGSLTINGITDDLFVALGDGDDSLLLGGGTTDTEIGFDVTITNQDDDETTITGVDIGGDLNIGRDDGTGGADAGRSGLVINESIIRGNLTADNDDGDTLTSITNSEIEGLLSITNGDGDDSTTLVSTTVGAALFVRPGGPGAVTNPVVAIANGDGSSLTSFTSANDADATGNLPTGELGRPTIFGGVSIVNGDPLPAGVVVPPPTAGGATPTELQIAVDIVVFNTADILGELNVDNFDGHTETIIVDSVIGADNKSLADGGYGGSAIVDNGDGYDITLVENSEIQYGLGINNDTGGTGTWGSQTDIRNVELGGEEGSLGADVALVFNGDDGDDVVNFVDTTGVSELDGSVTLNLNDGDDSVQMIGVLAAMQIDSVTIDGDEGDDMVYLENVGIDSMVMITLDGGVDTLEVRDGVSLPSGLTGTVMLDGGVGADFYFVNPGVATLENFDIQLLS